MGGFARGQKVRVVDGPFVDHAGIVDDFRDDVQKVKVVVSFFGRATPVELDYRQVERQEP
jgi:transcriptional antiterminator NusG